MVHMFVLVCQCLCSNSGCTKAVLGLRQGRVCKLQLNGQMNAHDMIVYGQNLQSIQNFSLNATGFN